MWWVIFDDSSTHWRRRLYRAFDNLVHRSTAHFLDFLEKVDCADLESPPSGRYLAYGCQL
jgi:hypothetical protein